MILSGFRHVYFLYEFIGNITLIYPEMKISNISIHIHRIKNINFKDYDAYLNTENNFYGLIRDEKGNC